ncbi:hypothetical protein RYD26_07020 [Pasteurellaceae bacterium LIM206]|nr:hypothetical protein [Pasteurellaceae bacterium LIM206]
MLEKIERLINEINKVYLAFSKDYFETGKVEKVNLKHTLAKKYGLKIWYLRNKDDYIGIHIYFKNSSNFYYPWELQVWDNKDAERNIQSHINYKRNFINKYKA